MGWFIFFHFKLLLTLNSWFEVNLSKFTSEWFFVQYKTSISQVQVFIFLWNLIDTRQRYKFWLVQVIQKHTQVFRKSLYRYFKKPLIWTQTFEEFLEWTDLDTFCTQNEKNIGWIIRYDQLILKIYDRNLRNLECF